MSGEKRTSTRRSRGRSLLDVVAFAGVESLRASEVLIAVDEAGSWRIRGSADAQGRPVEIADLAVVRELPADVVLAVSLSAVCGSTRSLTRPLGFADPEPGPPGSQYAVVGQGRRGPRIMVVADRPTSRSAAGLAECLTTLLDVAVDAVASELKGEQQKLRIAAQEREEERRRWARELHDDTLQQLGALQVLLTSARRRWDRTAGVDADELLATVDQATALLADQITTLRHLISELRPAALDELGLRAPVQALAERTETLTGLHVEVEMSLRYADGVVSTRLLPDIETAIYRVVQEALTNAARHSGASWARVSVIEAEDEVRVEVCDNGRGLVAGPTAGFGIQGMRERAELAGGRLEVSAAPADVPNVGDRGGGTRVNLVVPAVHRADDSG